MELLKKYLQDSKLLLIGFIITSSILWIGNISYSTTGQECLELSVESIRNEDFSNKIFCYQGVASSVVNSKKNKATYIFFSESEIPVQIAISVKHQLGKLTVNIKTGDTIRVKGTLYQSEKTKKIYITPLSIDDVEIVNDAPVCSTSIQPDQLQNHMDKIVAVQLSGIEARKFKSKNGKRHLSLKFSSGYHVFQGIMWDGNWSKSDIENVKSKKPLCITAKVGTYKGAISLDVKSIIKMESR